MKFHFLLIIFLIISLIISIFYKTNYLVNSVKEGLSTIDNKFLSIYIQPKDGNGNFFLQKGYYNIGNNNMAAIPDNYVLTSDSTGIITNIQTDFVNVKQDKNGNYNIPDGYYNISNNPNAGNNKMAIIPYGFVVNSSKTGITLSPMINTIHSSLEKKSPK